MVSSPTLNTTQDTSQYKFPVRHWGVQFSFNIVLTTITTFSTWNSKIYQEEWTTTSSLSASMGTYLPAEVGMKRRPADPQQ